MLQLNQLDFMVPQGSEAAVHTTRAYVNNFPADNALVKLDFKNAFSLLKKDVVLTDEQEHFTNLFSFVSPGYSKESMILFREHAITLTEDAHNVLRTVQEMSKYFTQNCILPSILENYPDFAILNNAIPQSFFLQAFHAKV